MRKIFTLITIFTMCAALQLEAQTRTVTGVVLDGGNNQPKQTGRKPGLQPAFGF